jgi:ATP-dependent Clp protease ATP-binding subunit ClpC
MDETPMNGSGSGGGKLFGRFTGQAHRVLDLAREEAERVGHCYLGPEHLLLGMLAEGLSGAAGARCGRQGWT